MGQPLLRRDEAEVALPPPRQPIVVFDLDNTLVHSRIDFPGIRRAVVEQLLAAGALAAPPADLRSRAIPEWLALAEAHGPRLGAELWALVDRYERDGMLAGTVEPDAAPTINRLAARGARLAVLTNNSLDSAQQALERFGLRVPFELLLARGVVPALKPAGVGVTLAHERLGGGPTFVVGDSYIDGLAAQRAGVGARFVAFRPNAVDLAARQVPVWRTVSALAEVPDLVFPDAGEHAADSPG